MCQLKAVIEREGCWDTVMESVTGVEVIDDGVVLTTYFEEPLTLRGVRISKLDFLGGKIVLCGEK